ncbi:hypothetical protein BN2537_1951 [Streptomyces venezuelae]|nr:hypothetical protein BN2537_1951 [Streptomyces venezuelae]
MSTHGSSLPHESDERASGTGSLRTSDRGVDAFPDRSPCRTAAVTATPL